ncbi:hypothetical protein AB2B38_010165 [Balneola sp. MJW-20]|uniref:hypothetical protein n=1 Tax=Gracilimonas aurantiaca TaxID=3234185 RepID=UPI0034662697
MSIGIWLGYALIGVLTGWVSHTFAGDRGLKLIPSLFFGITGALLGSSMVYAAELAGAGFMALIGSIAVLFTVYTFRQDEPIFDKAVA